MNFNFHCQYCIEITPLHRSYIAFHTLQGYDSLPICMAKTPLSLTGDPSIKGAPTGFTLKINNMTVSAGAGFVVAICGQVNIYPIAQET